MGGEDVWRAMLLLTRKSRSTSRSRFLEPARDGDTDGTGERVDEREEGRGIGDIALGGGEGADSGGEGCCKGPVALPWRSFSSTESRERSARDRAAAGVAAVAELPVDAEDVSFDVECVATGAEEDHAEEGRREELAARPLVPSFDDDMMDNDE